jgi:hypothetical protein
VWLINLGLEKFIHVIQGSLTLPLSVILQKGEMSMNLDVISVIKVIHSRYAVAGRPGLW